MKSKLYLFLLLFAIASSCSEQPQTVKEYSIAEIISNSKPITLSELGANIETIKLKTPDSITISSPRIITTPSYIYISSFPPRQVYRFDRQGNLLNKISAQGKAENEYLSILSMFLDTNDNLCVQDRDRVLTYTPEGEFLGSYEMKQVMAEESNSSRLQGGSLRNMFQDKKGNIFESFIVVMGNEKNRLVVTNPNKDTIAVSPNPIQYLFTGNITIILASKTVFYSGDDLVYHSEFSDSVYTFDYETSSLRLRYFFDNPKPLNNEDFLDIGKAIESHIFISDITEDSKYIYVTISDNNEKQLYLIDRKNGESFKADFNLGHPDDDELTFAPKWKSNDELVFFHDVTDQPEPTILLIKDFKQK